MTSYLLTVLFVLSFNAVVVCLLSVPGLDEIVDILPLAAAVVLPAGPPVPGLPCGPVLPCPAMFIILFDLDFVKFDAGTSVSVLAFLVANPVSKSTDPSLGLLVMDPGGTSLDT